MPRARMLKHGFFLNEKLAELKPIVRLLYAGLWTIADREGRLEDRPKRIKSVLFPYDSLDVDNALDALQDASFVVRYEILGQRYIAIPTFLQHQHPHIKEPPSTIPAPNGALPSMVQALDEPGAEHGTSPVQNRNEHRSSPAESLAVSGVGVLDPDPETERKEKEKRDSSSFSLDPEIARASKDAAIASPTEQAKVKHALGLDRRQKQGNPTDVRDLVGGIAAVAAAGAAKRGGT